MTCVFDNSAYDKHEQVIFVHDATVDLRGIIAIHNTNLGPAAGGCRMHPYQSVEDGLYDVLRLSRGMTYKSAMAGLPLGGGKCVIIADPNAPGKEQKLRAMGKHVQRLSGKFWTAIDVGVSPEDADVIAEECDYIFAKASEYTPGFNPSHFTVLGGFEGIKAVANQLRGTSDLGDLRVAVQGLGATGAELTALLVEHGAKVTVADVSDKAINAVQEKHNVTVASPKDIHAQDVDIFAPCALGAVINDQSIPELKAKAVVGLANNQLERVEHGQQLFDRNIIYVPDFIVNAGGMMGASQVIFTKPDETKARKSIKGLYTTITQILERSKKEGRPPEETAEEMADERIYSE